MFRLAAETEETIHNGKRLSEIVFSFLPSDAAGLRTWQNTFMASASKLDRAPHDVLAKWVLYHLSDRANAEEAAAAPDQGGLLGFSRHVAAELSKASVLNSNMELGVKTTSYIEARTNVGSGPLGGPMLLIVGQHFDYDRGRT